ncbi:MAG: toxin-antitoxin system protein [Candidatus Wallbacteria bacterium]|nr:toxin-antitoxin system protein [Candidatus Wallbacteria bacterium]
MGSGTIRITPSSHKLLKDLATRTGEPMQSLLDRAVDTYARQRFLDEANEAYATLRGDSAAWKQELREREEWDGTSMDGLEDD